METGIMFGKHHRNKSQFVKIVYSKKTVNGKVELIPLELYTDGSLKPIQ
ncbi:MAG: hypothetical protein F6J93_02010 [Oscillatoria sp. SIO1A7]|nr:hypothetical protein [Oscillatoria sp. SIO1A7]